MRVGEEPGCHERERQIIFLDVETVAYGRALGVRVRGTDGAERGACVAAPCSGVSGLGESTAPPILRLPGPKG